MIHSVSLTILNYHLVSHNVVNRIYIYLGQYYYQLVDFNHIEYYYHNYVTKVAGLRLS